MGRCYEFGVAIVDGCEHAMVVADEGGMCVCGHCGAECPGRFAACEGIVAQPGYVPISAPRWSIPGAVAVKTTVVDLPTPPPMAPVPGGTPTMPAPPIGSGSGSGSAGPRSDSTTWALGRELSAIRTLVQHVIDRQRESLPPVGVFDLITDLLTEAVGRDTAAAVALDRIEQATGAQARQLAAIESAVGTLSSTIGAIGEAAASQRDVAGEVGTTLPSLRADIQTTLDALLTTSSGQRAELDERIARLAEAQQGMLARIEGHLGTLAASIETLDHRIATLEALDAGTAARPAHAPGSANVGITAIPDPVDDLFIPGPPTADAAPIAGTADEEGHAGGAKDENPTSSGEAESAASGESRGGESEDPETAGTERATGPGDGTTDADGAGDSSMGGLGTFLRRRSG